MANNAKVAAIYVELQAQTAQFKAALGEATNATKQFAAQTREQMEGAKGSIELLGEQMGVVLPRHLREFVSKLPGVATAMSAAFNAVAIFALIDIVIKAGEKVVEFVKKTEDAAKKQQRAWLDTIGSIDATNDKLELTKTKLENAIDKLEHKPQNRIKEAIDEARVSADDLSKSLDTDIGKIADVFKNQQHNWFSQNVLHQTGGNSAATIASGVQDQFNEIEAGTFKGGTGDKTIDEDAVIRQAVSETYQKLVPAQALAAQVAANFGGKSPSNSSSAQDVQSLTALLAELKGMQETSTLTQNVNTDQSKLGTIQNAQEASADRLQTLQQEIDKRKALHQISLNEEVIYWEQHLKDFNEGSKEYLSALQKEAEAQQRMMENINAPGKLKKQGIDAAATPNAPAGYVVSPDGDLTKVAKDDDSLAQANTKAAESQAAINAEWQAATDKLGLLTGAISPHTAAMHEAAAHAEEYRLQIAALNEQLDRLQQNDAMDFALGGNTQHQAQEAQIKQQIAEIQAKAGISAMESAQTELTTSWQGMVDGVFDEIIKKAQDTQAQLQQITIHTVDALNEEMAKAITGQKTNFHGVFTGAATSFAKTGLQGIEGVGLKALGLGGGHPKADGYHVHVDNMPGSGPGGTSPGMPKAAGGILGMLNNSNWASSLFGGKLFGSGSIFGGGFASGGDVLGGIPIDVGELGPERFVPPSNGRIIPNKELKSSPSIGYIDARGTDPALTRENFARALQMTHAQAVGDAQHSIAERQMRRPH